MSHLDTGFSVWDTVFFFGSVFYSSDNFFQMLEKLVLHDFFGILAFSDFLKTNFGICSTKNMGKYFVLSDKLLHVACDTWPSLRRRPSVSWHLCGHCCGRLSAQTHALFSSASCSDHRSNRSRTPFQSVAGSRISILCN